MSAIEFCCKDYVKTSPEKIAQIKGRIYLRKILEESKNKGIVSDIEFTLWEDAIGFRNSLVHNNCMRLSIKLKLRNILRLGQYPI